MATISIDRARAIVKHAENEFASGEDILDAFAPFARGGATTRTEACNALKIVIAEFYRSAARQGQNAMQEFDQYARGSGGIALRIFCDAADSSEELEAIMRSNSQETIESFVQFLRTLSPGDPVFMKSVYERIGIPFPEQSAIDQTRRILQETKRPWWRTLIAFLICGLLTLGYFVFVSVAFGWKNGGGFIPVLIAGTLIMTLWGLIRGADLTDER